MLPDERPDRLRVGGQAVLDDGAGLQGLQGGIGRLDADGRATLPLVDTQQRPLTQQVAWGHDWPTTAVIIGAEISDATESRDVRDRVRRLARLRMDQPGDDAFLAEILASESAY